MKSAEIVELFPEVFRRTLRPDRPFGGLVSVMETLHAPSEDALSRLDQVLDPYRAPDDFVPYLASWLDLERLFDIPPMKDGRSSGARSPVPSGLGRLRELVAQAAVLSQWRGTSRGLLRFLAVATGEPGFEIDERVPDGDGRPIPFHIVVRAPERTRVHAALLRRIIEQEKPAYVTYRLVFKP